MRFIQLKQSNGQLVYVAATEIAAIVGRSREDQSVLYLKGHDSCITVLGAPEHIAGVLSTPPKPFQPPDSSEGGGS